MIHLAKQFFKKTDKLLLFTAVICSFYSLFLVYSATLSFGSARFLVVQGGAIVLGIALFIFLTFADISNISQLWRWLFLLGCLFLASVYVFGVGMDETGNRSWIRFGSIGIQPAETVKFLFAITLSRHISAMDCQVNKLSNLAQLLLHTLIPVVIIVATSRDMGMALPYIFILLVLLFVAGLKLRWLAFLGGLIAAITPILWFFVLTPAQKMRILVVFDPTLDPAGKGYQALQSKIAIGAGQIFGRGLTLGSQTQNSFLPAKQTDFIFAVAGEELGIIGSMAILLLLTVIVLRCFTNAAKITHPFSSLLCAAVGAMFLFQLVINIGMCIGLMPVIGITLPFFSYGGSSMVTSFACLGLAASAYYHRPMAF